MLLLTSTSDKVQVVTGQAASVDVHTSYVDTDIPATPTSNVSTGRKNTAISTAATTDVVTSPASAVVRNVKTLHIRNKHASASVDITVQHTDGTTAVELHKTTLAAGEALQYIEGVGFFELGAAAPALGGLGTPSTADQSLTVSVANVLGGTLVQLPTNNLRVGSRFRFNINVVKTSAGTANWTCVLKWGVAGTNADAAVATWTSGTNTAAVDQANLHIEAVVASLGAAATMNCIAIYSNATAPATGLGTIGHIPNVAAAFDSTLSNPYLHVDITPGANAVFTAVSTAERLA